MFGDVAENVAGKKLGNHHDDEHNSTKVFQHKTFKFD